ncbi:MAG: tetratricopeptide repeat protein [Propionivibrio sp.]|uniref:tetratricopeptide repeat protein n=1 Tax=Propionivibrio sp. TaxID=2212460 RepID=UPI0025E14613|nr:tetratricopeptide repeat protein [Propionivibrio sp.]MBL0207154.1 tetratricopeptide repeat protein [Propionivibrio sp.]
MTRRLFALVLLFVTLSAHAAGFEWSSLWRNADQRGELLMHRGDAAAAAEVFTDPRRKAHAELIAGQYAQAARDFAVFDDSDAHYNRGNALAHASDLPGALHAYDAALQRDPGNKDARHNRDLVADALKQNPPPPPQGSSNHSKDDDQSGAQSANTQDSPSSSQSSRVGDGNQGVHARADNATRPDVNSDSKAQGKAASNDSNRNGQAGKPAAAPPVMAANHTPGASTLPKDKLPEVGSVGAMVPAEPDSAAEAQRDAAANLARAAPDALADPANQHRPSPGEPPPVARFNEQQLAQEQWLRNIPDDPGGLLRRKFLIEHLMRQQKAQP